MPKNFIAVTKTDYTAIDDAITVLRMHSRAGCVESKEALFGMLALASKYEEAANHREPTIQLGDEAAS